ncbi:MAG: permease prefix domain 1-containing protein [Planctomycetota bacterium]
MSEREFEAYLNLLARTLKLSEAQRQRIAGELRDHLEERLEELTERGMDRDAAILAALDEFGDAGVLASRLGRPSRRRSVVRRRLRWSAAAVALCALLVAPAWWWLRPAAPRGVTPGLNTAGVARGADAMPATVVCELRLLVIPEGLYADWRDEQPVSSVFDGVTVTRDGAEGLMRRSLADRQSSSVTLPRLSLAEQQRSYFVQSVQSAWVLPGAGTTAGSEVEVAAVNDGVRLDVLAIARPEDGVVEASVSVVTQWGLSFDPAKRGLPWDEEFAGVNPYLNHPLPGAWSPGRNGAMHQVRLRADERFVWAMPVLGGKFLEAVGLTGLVGGGDAGSELAAVFVMSLRALPGEPVDAAARG